MGLLRILLALAVVFAHSPWNEGYAMVGGRNAVQMFYMISGFLMSHILVTKNKYPNPVRFYISRWLRIYPLYFAVALLTLPTIFSSQSHFIELYRKIPTTADILLFLSNLLVLGQDWVMFFAVNDGQLGFSTNFQQSDFLLYTGLLVPQAWTLGIELTFYLLAPFLLHNRKVIWGFLAASVFARLGIFYVGLGTLDPWTYRFFPAELALFLIGALSNQILLPMWERFIERPKMRRMPEIATYLLAGFAIIYFIIPVNEWGKGTVLFVAFAVLLPLLFIHQDRSRFDQAIGELSYPIYVGHLLVVRVGDYFIGKFVTHNVVAISIANIVGALIFAVILNKYIGRRVEAFRTRLAPNQKLIYPIKIETAAVG